MFFSWLYFFVLMLVVVLASRLDCPKNKSAKVSMKTNKSRASSGGNGNVEPCCRCDCWIDGGKEEARLRMKSVIDMLLYLRFYVFFFVQNITYRIHSFLKDFCPFICLIYHKPTLLFLLFDLDANPS